MKYRKLLKIYILHWRLYIFTWLLIALVIAVPLALKTYINGKIYVCYDDYELNSILSNDILIQSSRNINWYDKYPLSNETLNSITSMIKELNLDKKVELSTFSFLEARDSITSYYIAPAIDEPGYKIDLILSDKIPSGYFSYNENNRNVPSSITLVSPSYHKGKELKKLETPINYPLSYKYRYAINSYDAKALKIHANQSEQTLIVLDFATEKFTNFDIVYLTIGASNLTQDEKGELINRLEEDEDILVLCNGDYGYNLSASVVFGEMKNWYSINLSLKETIDLISKAFFYISCCALIILSIQVNGVRNKEYNAFKRLGLQTSSYLILRICEDFFSVVIATFIAFIILVVAKGFFTNIPVKEFIISSVGGRENFKVLTSDVFAQNGRYVFNIPYLEIFKEGIIFFGVIIIIDVVIELMKGGIRK